MQKHYKAQMEELKEKMTKKQEVMAYGLKKGRYEMRSNLIH